MKTFLGLNIGTDFIGCACGGLEGVTVQLTTEFELDGQRHVQRAICDRLSEFNWHADRQLIHEEAVNRSVDDDQCLRWHFVATDHAIRTKITSEEATLATESDPRIAVTVDTIAMGTDEKPLECQLFMRNINSWAYFKQMKGRGSRVINSDKISTVTPEAKHKTALRPSAPSPTNRPPIRWNENRVGLV